MWTLGAIGFATPWLLGALAALPVLWFLLRVVPPAPVRRRFPGVVLLLGLRDDETQSDKTPWWLLLLRMLAVAALILAFAGPVLNPQARDGGSGPLLVLVDATWADAPDWAARMARVEQAVTDAGRSGRPVAVVAATDLPPGGSVFTGAEAVLPNLPQLAPAPHAPDPDVLADWAAGLEGRFATLWLSDGLARDSRAPLLAALEDRGPVRVAETPRPVMALRPPVQADGAITLTGLRNRTGLEQAVTVVARGLDPAGVERDLAEAELAFAADATQAETVLVLPPELRNRITRFAITGESSAGAVSLTDDALRRREVALIAGRDDREGLQLLSPLHYLEQALAPSADLIDGALEDILLANPDAIILADVARLADPQPLVDWVDSGGLLVRFAGPRLAAAESPTGEADPLLPVRLRAGGRSVGGAMSWGEPKQLAPFPEDGPFRGLPVPDDVSVSAQVLAEPDPELSNRTIAALSDGTPLVTRTRIGSGQVVLFHVTANAEWSTLPLSGLFVQMLDRLAVSSQVAAPDPGDLAGTMWQPVQVMDAFGRVSEAGRLTAVPGERLAAGVPGPDMPPGVYTGGDRRIALNIAGPDTVLAPAAWPSRIAVEGLAVAQETPLAGVLLALVLILVCADLLGSLALSGKLPRLSGPARRAAAVALAMLLVPLGATAPRAQDGETRDTVPEDIAIAATSDVVLAHVITGDARVDEIARAGLDGLSQVLFSRTSIEPAAPRGVNLETDELAFYPFLYWPVTDAQPIPSAEAYARLNTYLRTGGMILFDTRDADVSGPGGSTATGRKLQRLARPLDIPPLEPLPNDHVLTRTFYLLQDFPGRYTGRDLWVEAAPPDAELVEGMPFRNLNDGVTPVVIGGNDWAAAWALDDRGGRMFPVGRGYAGERQRELAFRFGVNLVMHVLTGNYKSDQVHVPALLDRLGN
ncbi:DUF4159 domain-containing protein [Meridianimarinicoccus sp. RP-17]|uniref:DUF4159 domain-containing protein n=1 Tax=Meridianimarinicoccus zhengii TaxID=2056810 RepID=UPI000DACF398|nr:DUF4159 domain-containing protein [Phycocomes zhengii]